MCHRKPRGGSPRSSWPRRRATERGTTGGEKRPMVSVMNTSRALALITILLASPLFAASEFPPSYRWRTIETQHFLVHYHQGEEELARHAALIGERIHQRISPLLGWQPTRRTHLILTDHIDA